MAWIDEIGEAAYTAPRLRMRQLCIASAVATQRVADEYGKNPSQTMDLYLELMQDFQNKAKAKMNEKNRSILIFY